MLLRTLEIPDGHGRLLNAVVLLGFCATCIDRRFLVYSLNEKSDDEMVKIYLTALEGEGLTLNMYDTSLEVLTTATQVLKNIIRDGCAVETRPTDDTYSVMDLADTNILCSPVSTHYSLKISDAWLNCLLHYHSDTHETPQHALLGDLSNPEFNATHAGSIFADEQLANEQVTSKIEASLKLLVANMLNHKENLLEKYVTLESRERDLELRTQQLKNQEMIINQREDALRAVIESMQPAEQQLNALLDN
ncbi:hypothetical protein JH25_03745 [Pseudomonas sp. BRG-100]|uniref:hypothetical protein n=1 Tax=Pseudomonas sp. BRG-100 TaxID=1524267 RepID=UPI0004E7702A|nr:hypothetical protein [Pseudomonas sp. BRG-100]KFF42923.1 hypothetical protein JH25_03745 [Pseudomonas sp. BRG-100]